MKKTLTLLIALISTNTNAAYLFRNSATNINSGTLDPARVSPSSFTLYGSTIPNFALDPTSVTLLGSNIPASAITGSLPVSQVSGIGNSTFSYLLYQTGPVYLSTTVPVVSRFATKSTFTMVGYQACVGKASSSTVTAFQLVYSTSSQSSNNLGNPYQNYGVTYTPFTNWIMIDTQARCSQYASSVATIYQDWEYGVRVMTTSVQFGSPSPGLPSEEIRFNISGWENRNTNW